LLRSDTKDYCGKTHYWLTK